MYFCKYVHSYTSLQYTCSVALKRVETVAICTLYY